MLFTNSLLTIISQNNSCLILGGPFVEAGVFLDFIGSKRIILTFYLELRISISAHTQKCHCLSETVSEF